MGLHKMVRNSTDLPVPYVRFAQDREAWAVLVNQAQDTAAVGTEGRREERT